LVVQEGKRAISSIELLIFNNK